MSYREEFPDFPEADMPAIPAGWEDISWHNDACPSFDMGEGRVVYVDYADKAQREWPDAPRFVVTFDPGDNSSIRTVLETDDWAEVLTPGF